MAKFWKKFAVQDPDDDSDWYIEDVMSFFKAMKFTHNIDTLILHAIVGVESELGDFEQEPFSRQLAKVGCKSKDDISKVINMIKQEMWLGSGTAAKKRMKKFATYLFQLSKETSNQKQVHFCAIQKSEEEVKGADAEEEEDIPKNGYLDAFFKDVFEDKYVQQNKQYPMAPLFGKYLRENVKTISCDDFVMITEFLCETQDSLADVDPDDWCSVVSNFITWGQQQ